MSMDKHDLLFDQGGFSVRSVLCASSLSLNDHGSSIFFLDDPMIKYFREKIIGRASSSEEPVHSPMEPSEDQVKVALNIV